MYIITIYQEGNTKEVVFEITTKAIRECAKSPKVIFDMIEQGINKINPKYKTTNQREIEKAKKLLKSFK